MRNIMLLIGNLTNGGAEHSIINVANELSKYHNVILVAPNKKCDYDCNVNIIEINEFSYKLKKIIGIYKLRKLKKKYNIDVTISYTTAYNFYNILSKYKDKTIISVRNHLSAKKEGFKYTIIHKISSFFADKIVCCSKSVMKDQIENYKVQKNKLCVIPNFCNNDIINDTIKKELYDESFINENTIISMARLVSHKGHMHVINAMRLVVSEIPDARLLIFGSGPMKEDLELKIKEYNLENNVILMGFNSLPYAYIDKAKALVLASSYEGFPNVIIEAMACGTPVISTDSYGGAKEILTDESIIIDELKEVEYGILIPRFSNNIEKNTNILKDAIMKILTDDKLYNYYHDKSLERIEKYNKDIIIKKWLEVIE